jgi:hypothetical protein
MVYTLHFVCGTFVPNPPLSSSGFYAVRVMNQIPLDKFPATIPDPDWNAGVPSLIHIHCWKFFTSIAEPRPEGAASFALRKPRARAA